MSFFDFFRKKTPSEPSPLREATPAERRAKPRKNVRPGTKVLIIDDSKTVCAVLSRMLRENNFVTYEALDAERGIQVMEEQLPELVFLDIVLPGMSGFEALRKMRRTPTIAHIPIIMISGNESATEQFYVQRIGANDFMKKPFSRAEVFSRVERVLDLVPTILRAPASGDLVR
jgi:twitching motility two-component system response regulator PilH